MVNKENSINNNDLKRSATETEKIIGRLKEALKVKSDGQLANYLGISRQNIGAARKREDVPPGWIDKVATLTGCSMDWLRFGKGPRIRAAYTTNGLHHGGQIASQQSPYDPRGEQQPGPGDKLRQEADSFGFGAAVEMLAKIYSSEDEMLISTINANIRAFCEAIDNKQRQQKSTQQLENLKKRLLNIEQQLKRAKPRGKNKRKPKS
jgi:hypothetical protein